MTLTLNYGIDFSIELDFGEGVLLAHCDGPRDPEAADATGAAREALAHPVDMLPLSQCVTPGDKVTLAIDRPAGNLAEVVAVVVESLVAAGVQADDITCLLSNSGDDGDRERLEARVGGEVQFRTHAADVRTELGYLAATASGEPIYLDRLMVEADVVVPIGYLRPRADAALESVHRCLFPQFSDTATARRLQSSADGDGKQARQSRDEADQVGRLLGVLFTVQVIPGAGGRVRNVITGEPSAVHRRAGRTRDEAWRFEVPRRSSLVVAAVSGSPEQQTWANVARALDAAAQVVGDEGSVAICSDLNQPLDGALRSIAGADDPREVLNQLKSETSCETSCALQIVRTLDRARVYLLSQLDEDVVEALGMAPISRASELSRLIERHDTCIVLANAQDTVAVVAEEQT